MTTLTDDLFDGVPKGNTPNLAIINCNEFTIETAYYCGKIAADALILEYTI